MKNRDENTTIFLLSYSIHTYFLIFFKILIMKLLQHKKPLDKGLFILYECLLMISMTKDPAHN